MFAHATVAPIDAAPITPIYATPKQMKPLFNTGLTTLHRIEKGRHRWSGKFPRPKVFGGRKLYDVAAVKAFFDALPEDEKNPRQPPTPRAKKIAP
jgi:hypothetical protein